MIWELRGLSDHIDRKITLSVITLSGFHCIIKPRPNNSLVSAIPGYNKPKLKRTNFDGPIEFVISKFDCTVKPVYNGHPWDPKKLAVVDRWPLLIGFSIKIAIEFDLAGLRLAVVGRWPLFRGGR